MSKATNLVTTKQNTVNTTPLNSRQMFHSLQGAYQRLHTKDERAFLYKNK